MGRVERWACAMVPFSLFSVAVACDGGAESGDDGSGADRADSGADPGSDAGGLDAGDRDAGDDAGHGPDAGEVDAGKPDAGHADAGEPDASPEPGLVTFRFELSPYPYAGHEVFFLRDDDSVVEIAVTDEEGRAQAMFEEPGTVVVHFRPGVPPSQDALVAYRGVPPGASIYFGLAPEDRAALLTVSGPAPENPTSFGVETQCGRLLTGPPPIFNIQLQFCPPQVGLVWTATTEVDGQTSIWSAFLPSVPVETGSVVVPGPLRPDVAQTTRLVGLPELGSLEEFSYRVYGAHGIVQEGLIHNSVEVIGGAVAVEDSLHELRGLGLRGRLLTQLFSPETGEATDVMAWVEHDGAPTVDVGSMVPVSISNSVLDRATGIWTWNEQGSGAISAVQGFIYMTSGPMPFYWRVIAPHDGTSIRVPRLPPPYDVFNITADSPVQDLEMQLLGHTRGYGPILADLEGVVYFTGQVGDIVTVTYGFDDVVQ